MFLFHNKKYTYVRQNGRGKEKEALFSGGYPAGRPGSLRGGHEPAPGEGGLQRAQVNFAVGSFDVAVYDKALYVAQVEGDEPEEETEGFTLLKYIERKDMNQVVWGKKLDRLKTLHTDILLKEEPPIPVSSRLWGLPKDVAKEVEKLFRMLWSIIFQYFICLNAIYKDFSLG